MDDENKNPLPPENQRPFIHLPVYILKKTTNIYEMAKNRIESRNNANIRLDDQHNVDFAVQEIYNDMQRGIWCVGLKFNNVNGEENNKPGILKLDENNVMKVREEKRDKIYRKFSEPLKPFLYMPYNILRSTTNLDKIAADFLHKRKMKVNQQNMDTSTAKICSDLYKYIKAADDNDKYNIYGLESLKFKDNVS